MDPCLVDREKRGIQRQRHPAADHAAMEPCLVGREKPTAAHSTAHGLLPQWSPALLAGRSRHRHRRGAHEGHAAMEPCLVGREKRRPDRRRQHAGLAAMEPCLVGREKSEGVSLGSDALHEPQWSPALSAGRRLYVCSFQKLVVPPQWSPALSAGRRPVCLGVGMRVALVPQWSPALSAGRRLSSR